MLKKIGAPENFKGEYKKIEYASFPAPFDSSLEYNAPVRGTWNIVHTGMLIPESHQIFVCARGCLRGVIMTAAEMNAMNRMSWVSVSEEDMFEGDLESKIIDGSVDILERLDNKPKVVLLFLSCIHFFAGCDFEMIIASLSEKFPDISFIDSYMHPTMRKSGLTPDETMRRQLYKPLKEMEKSEKSINILGNDRKTIASSELIQLLSKENFEIRDITLCKNYSEYLDMAKSSFNIVYLPVAKPAGMELEKRLGQKMLYLPLSYSDIEIEENYKTLCENLKIPMPELTEYKKEAKDALLFAKKMIGNTPVDIDYTATPRPLSLARLLLENGFNVRRIYADGFIPEEQKDFIYLKENFPQLVIYSTLNAKMRFFSSPDEGKVLAIGQKSAYFSNTEYFVNIVAGGGYYGFDGIKRIAKLMCAGFMSKKDTKKVVQYKGLGCESCI